MAIRDLKTQITRLPEQPGVYLYFNAAGDTLYVGRARALRDRVRSYLSAYGSSPKTDALLDEVTRLEVIVTDSLVEALALENHLIKQRSPRFNILLRDDKNYPYLQLTSAEAFPRVLVARRVARDGSYYAGPFLPATLARKTMSLTHKLFGIRSCNEVITGRRGRACLEYDIKRCVAPCVEEICSPAQYAEAVAHTRMFLEGRNDELIVELKRRMLAASDDLRYEEAAHTRDAIETLETLRDRQQKMSTVRLGDRDAFGVKTGPAGAVIQVFQMRGGRVIERVELVVEASGDPPTEQDTVQAAVQQFYDVRVAPPDVHVPVEIEDREALERWLSERAGRKVKLAVPKRGDKRGLLDLATRNAALGYQTRGTATRAGCAARRSRSCNGCWVWGCCRDGSSASTSRRSRAARPSGRWWSAKTAGSCAKSTASTGCAAAPGERSARRRRAHAGAALGDARVRPVSSAAGGSTVRRTGDGSREAPRRFRGDARGGRSAMPPAA